MIKTEILEKAHKLPVEERLELAEALWESFEMEANELPFPKWQKRLFDERLEAGEKAPDGCLSWAEVKQGVLGASVSPKDRVRLKRALVRIYCIAERRSRLVRQLERLVPGPIFFEGAPRAVD